MDGRPSAVRKDDKKQRKVLRSLGTKMASMNMRRKNKSRPLVTLSDYTPFIDSPAPRTLVTPLPVFANSIADFCETHDLAACVFDPQVLILSANALDHSNESFERQAEKILEAKLKIMSVRVRFGIDIWTLAAQVVNPYEIVPCFAAPVLNRAFFKMWELNQALHLVPTVAQSPRFLSAHLCEAPGGFVQAILTYRSRTASQQERVGGSIEHEHNCQSRTDSWFAITLADDKGHTLKMENRKLQEAACSRAHGYLHYGADESGDITNPANIISFVAYVLKQSKGAKMQLITADGAFDVSDDFALQEQCHARLVFCEIVTSLKLQAVEGSLVLKLFDCFTETTATVLFILSLLYSNVDIARLCTSRVCNSERYVVARGFRGLSSNLEDRLVALTEAWRESTCNGSQVAVMLSSGLHTGFLKTVGETNDRMLRQEIESIKRAISVAEDIGERLSFMNDEGTRKGVVSILRRKLKTLENLQGNARCLCKALDIPLPNIL